jgi:hypothetical protein
MAADKAAKDERMAPSSFPAAMMSFGGLRTVTSGASKGRIATESEIRY